MLAEARELYNYTVGNEPFRSQIEEIRDNQYRLCDGKNQDQEHCF
ncbi:MAG: hypothetical protein ACLTZM_20705 [Ruminococcus sp.]